MECQKIKKNSLKLMLTQQTLDLACFESHLGPNWIYSWYMALSVHGFLVVEEYFLPGSYVDKLTNACKTWDLTGLWTENVSKCKIELKSVYLTW